MNYSWKDKAMAYLYYTIGFMILMGVILGIFSFNRMSLVFVGDAITQHLPMRVYINEFFRNLINNIDVFNFNIAMGQDILFTHHYYGLTDIVNLIISILSDVFNLKPYFSYVLEFSFRGYLAGMAFLYLCIYFKNGKTASILGSFVYVFSNYFLCGGIMHPFFINAMIFLPLLIIGVNKIIDEERYVFFVIIAVLSILSNIYFSYTRFIFIFFYAIFTIVERYKKNGFVNSIKSTYRGIVLFVLSVLISSFILIPFVYSLINSNRARLYGKKLELLVGYRHMYNYFINMFSYPNVENFVSVSILSIVLIALIMFLFTKGRYKLKFILVLLILTAFSPVVQNALNGFIYPGYRWYYALTLILSYIFVIEYENILNSKKWIKILTTILVIGYICVYIIEKIDFETIFSKGILDGLTNPSFYNHVGIIVSLVIALIIMNVSGIKYRKYVFAVVVFVSLITNVSIYALDSVNSNRFENKERLHEFLNNRTLQNVSNEVRGSFVRVENDNPLYVNASTIYNYPSINGYYSMINKNLSRFNLIYKNSAASPLSNIMGLGSRSILDDVFSVKYLIAEKDYIIPYGFEKTPINNLYVNKNYIPFGFTYSNYILPYEAATLSSLELQEMLMKSCLVDNNVDGVKHLDSVNLTEVKLKQNNVKFTADTANKDNKIEKKYTCNPSYDGELYMKLPNEDLEKGESFDVFVNGKFKRVDVTTKKSKWYSGEKEALICLGYVNKGDVRVIVKIKNNGNPNFENIAFECFSTDSLNQDARELSKEHLYNISISESGFKGYISNEGTKLLFISIPYSEGWSAYVDSEKTKIYRANEGFMAIKLGSGDHFVEFKYNRPYQELSYVISSISAIVTVIYLFKIRKRKVEEVDECQEERF